MLARLASYAFGSLAFALLLYAAFFNGSLS